VWSFDFSTSVELIVDTRLGRTCAAERVPCQELLGGLPVDLSAAEGDDVIDARVLPSSASTTRAVIPGRISVVTESMKSESSAAVTRSPLRPAVAPSAAPRAAPGAPPISPISAPAVVPTRQPRSGRSRSSSSETLPRSFLIITPALSLNLVTPASFRFLIALAAS